MHLLDLENKMINKLIWEIDYQVIDILNSRHNK